MTACRILDGKGLTEAFGHVSARCPDGSVRVTPRRAPGLVTDPSQLVRIELDGTGAEADADRVPPEVHLHLAVYRRRPDVGAVCRFHGPATLALSTVTAAIRPTVGYGAYLGAAVPVHPDPRLARTAPAGDAVAASLGEGAAVALRGNGAVTVGSSIRQACVRAIFLEKTAQAVLSAAALGAPQVLDDEEVAAFASLPDATTRQIERAWDYYAARHRNDTTIRWRAS